MLLNFDGQFIFLKIDTFRIDVGYWHVTFHRLHLQWLKQAIAFGGNAKMSLHLHLILRDPPKKAKSNNSN